MQLDPGTAALLQNVVGNLTNITMLTNTLAVRTQASSLSDSCPAVGAFAQLLVSGARSRRLSILLSCAGSQSAAPLTIAVPGNHIWCCHLVSMHNLEKHCPVHQSGLLWAPIDMASGRHMLVFLLHNVQWRL